jgi:hypothetical protein
MNNVMVDDRRIRVDFSQSVGKLWQKWAGKGAGKAGAGAGHYVGCERACGSPLTGPVLVASGEGFQTLARPTVG